MSILKASIATLALVGMASAASAANRLPGNGGPLPSVTSQIMKEARSAGVLKGLSKPQLHLDYSKSGKTVTATITAMSKFGGPPTPLPHPERLPVANAKFRIAQVTEGRIASPIKQSGEIWEHFMRALAVK